MGKIKEALITTAAGICALTIGVGAIGLWRSMPDERCTVYSIEQRGMSPVRPAELVKREYLFRDTDATPGMDDVFVFEDVVDSSATNNGFSGGFMTWQDSYRLSGQGIQSLYLRISEQEPRNNEVWENWIYNYDPFTSN